MNEELAAVFFEIHAIMGYKDSQYRIARYYDRGKYVQQNTKKAIEYNWMAVNQKHPDACFRLADRYLKGDGFPQNVETALDWFQKAGDYGHDMRYARIGRLYLDGKYVQQDYEEAFRWFYRSAKAGYMSGCVLIGNMVLEGKYFDNLDAIVDSEDRQPFYTGTVEVNENDTFLIESINKIIGIETIPIDSPHH